MEEFIFDARSNLFPENKYHYNLQDVKSPNLFGKLFSCNQLPKVILRYIAEETQTEQKPI